MLTNEFGIILKSISFNLIYCQNEYWDKALIGKQQIDKTHQSDNRAGPRPQIALNNYYAKLLAY